MTSDNLQETIDRILEQLRSGDPAHCLNALQELSQINASSKAIFLELEQLAIHGSDELQKEALLALSSRANRYIAAQRSLHSKFYRNLILKEIDEWEKDGLIEPHRAEVLRRHYDFDFKPATAPQPSHREVPQKNEEAQSAAPVGPRPSLTQTLLSEASIKIYLYLGAFFVIASALILAAVVEAVRLPILAVATLAFGGGAFVLRKRLPQPSFALFIVFSFLLPIDANAFEETLGFLEPSLSIYWTIIFLMMTAIWSFSIWFYESRFFSAVAFVSLSLAFYRAGQIFDTEIELQISSGMLASLLGLAGTWALRKWKDHKFSLPVFLLAQVQVLGLLFLSLVFVMVHTFEADFSNGWWILITVTWLIAALFYALSDLLTPTFFFPWMAIGALLPLPWFFLRTFEVPQSAYALGFWAWGTVFALTSETLHKFSFEKTKQYYWALLAGSAPLFLMAFSIALDRGTPGFTFAVFALSALVYTALHFVHPRWYVWSAALLGALCAYFTFFQLPAIARLEVAPVYQVLIASTLLVLPELFATSPLSLKSETRWPPIALGILLSTLGLALALADLDYPGRGALTLIVYAVLFTLHALHSKRAWLVYFGTAAESLAVVYALNHFNLDLWLPALTLLVTLYYATGFFFRRQEEEMKPWGNVLVNSGLTLGSLLSLASLLTTKETSGWYLIVIALLFAVEIFARPAQWLELAVEVLLSFALYLLLDDFNVTDIGHFLFGASLIWLGSDLTFGRLIQDKRLHRTIPVGVGLILVVISTFSLLGALNPVVPTIYFLLYAVFFAFYAYARAEPNFAYAATAFLPLAVIKLCEGLNFELWTFPLIFLAALYYLSGFALRREQRTKGWDEILLHSGLTLGVLTSIGVVVQGGLDASIPVAIAATLFAAEAFARRNVWWALPANLLYLLSYFMILIELNVDEPQFYSIGAALLGMLMHYLLTRAGGKTGAFLAGMLSQLVLLGTTYIQMVSTERLWFFFVLFIQSMMVLLYGLIQRSRSLVITPIVFAVIGVMTVVYSALKGLGPVILIGSTGLLLLTAGIVAVLMRERITRIGEQLSDWKP